MAGNSPLDRLAISRLNPQTRGGRNSGGGGDNDRGSVIDPLTINVFNSKMEKLIKATQRQATFLSQPFSVADTPILLRQRENRTYFLLQNTGLNSFYVGFDFQPTQVNGLNITSGAFAEPYQVPTNDIWIKSTIAGTTGILIYSIGN